MATRAACLHQNAFSNLWCAQQHGKLRRNLHTTIISNT